MRLPLFTEDFICTSGAHCGFCRNLDGARAWRGRQAKRFTMPDGAPDFACPKDLPWGYKPPPGEPKPKPARRRQAVLDLAKVRALWAELHRRAASPDLLDADAERAWIDDFTKRVPCGECKQHWRALLKAKPPDM